MPDMDREMEPIVLANALATISQGVLICNRERKIIYCNRAFVDITGFHGAEILGRNCAFLQGPGTASRAVENIRRALDAGETFTGEILNYRRSAESFYNDLVISPVRNEFQKVDYYIGIIRDMTAQQLERKALADLEASYRFLFDHLRAGVVLHEASTAILYANAMAERLLGLSREQMIGMYDSDPRWRFVREDGSRLPLQEYPVNRARAMGGVASSQVLGVRRSDDKRVVWLMCNAYAASPDAAHAGNIVVSFTDITELKETERALRILTGELEARVELEVAAKDVVRTKLAAGQRTEALGQLAGGVAHDLNNVLQAVSSAAQLLRQHTQDATHARRMVDVIDAAAERGAAVTRRMLAFARRGELRTEAVDVAELLTGLTEMLSHTLGDAISVEVDVSPTLPPALADRGQFETVLINFVTNARDAMQEGEGRVVLSARAAEVTSRDTESHCLLPGRYIKVTVADNGSGMAPAVLQRATEPFFTTKPVGQGTGLGLSMAKGFAEQSGGCLTLQSELGRGTTVEMWLPQALAMVVCLPEEVAELVVADQKRARILLVDDDKFVRQLLAEELRAIGHVVEQASNGKAAPDRLLAKDDIDVLITDLSMPGIDGLQLIRQAQQHAPDLPAILITGYADDGASLALTGAMSGSFSLLQKPIRVAHLEERIASALEKA
jgi:PAS domain S-box-containing protein